MEPLKEMFNQAYFEKLAAVLGTELKIDRKGFLEFATHDLTGLSLNQRMRRASETLQLHLPPDFKKSMKILKQVAPKMPRGYTSLVFPDFVGLYGKQHFDVSMDALKYFTSFGSSEFAVREFLRADFERAIHVMKTWATDTNVHVRRLASEGSRPRLPWSFKLQQVIDDPGLTTPILNALKSDKELYVKKSVANHLNDIAKEHPEYMLSTVGKWNQGDPHTAWIIRHGSRSLIKSGHPGALGLFNFKTNVKVSVEKLKISPPQVKLGDSLNFEFLITSGSNKTQKLAVDYIVHYKKSSGALSAKVFKLKELDLSPRQTLLVSKKQVIKDFTTRKHHAGKHLLEIQVNGKVMASGSFNLLTNP